MERSRGEPKNSEKKALWLGFVETPSPDLLAVGAAAARRTYEARRLTVPQELDITGYTVTMTNHSAIHVQTRHGRDFGKQRPPQP